MFFIKTCPSCSRKLRFPIDKGKIVVKCTCGYSFTADPDNPEIYKDGSFDLRTGKKKSGLSSLFKKTFSINKIKNINLKSIVNSLLDYKYKISNFRLLPSKDQRKIILFIISVLLFLAIMIYFINYYNAKPKVYII